MNVRTILTFLSLLLVLLFPRQLCAIVLSMVLRLMRWLCSYLLALHSIAWFDSFMGWSIVYICSCACLTILQSILRSHLAIAFFGLHLLSLTSGFCSDFYFLFLYRRLLLMVMVALVHWVVPVARGMFVPIPCFQWAALFPALVPSLNGDILQRWVRIAIARLLEIIFQA